MNKGYTLFKISPILFVILIAVVNLAASVLQYVIPMYVVITATAISLSWFISVVASAGVAYLSSEEQTTTMGIPIVSAKFTITLNRAFFVMIIAITSAVGTLISSLITIYVHNASLASALQVFVPVVISAVVIYLQQIEPAAVVNPAAAVINNNRFSYITPYAATVQRVTLTNAEYPIYTNATYE